MINNSKMVRCVSTQTGFDPIGLCVVRVYWNSVHCELLKKNIFHAISFFQFYFFS